MASTKTTSSNSSSSPFTHDGGLGSFCLGTVTGAVVCALSINASTVNSAAGVQTTQDQVLGTKTIVGQARSPVTVLDWENAQSQGQAKRFRTLKFALTTDKEANHNFSVTYPLITQRISPKTSHITDEKPLEKIIINGHEGTLLSRKEFAPPQNSPRFQVEVLYLVNVSGGILQEIQKIDRNNEAITVTPDQFIQAVSPIDTEVKK